MCSKFRSDAAQFSILVMEKSSPSLSRTLSKGRVANNVADSVFGLEGPETSITVGESDIPVPAPKDDDWLAGQVKNFAAKVLLDQISNNKLNSLVGTI